MQRDRIIISLKLWLFKLRILVRDIVRLFSLLLAIFGGYTILQPWLYLQFQSAIISSLPVVGGFSSFDGILILVAGMILFAVSSKL